MSTLYFLSFVEYAEKSRTMIPPTQSYDARRIWGDPCRSPRCPVHKKIAFLFIIVVPMLWAPVSFGANTPKSADASERAQRRLERERQFLYRAVEDLSRSQGYIQAATSGMEKKIDAVDVLEFSKREKDIGSFLDWYRSYAEWLGSNLDDFEADLTRSYADEPGVIVQPERCTALVDGYTRMGTLLEEQVSHLDKLNDSALQRIAGLRLAWEYVTSAAFIEERSREKRQPLQGNYQRKTELYERYRDITDIEIAMMQREITDLDELQKHFLVLLEMGRMEQSWIIRKAGDYDALGGLARVVGRDALASIEEASNKVIKLYDSDRAYFKRKADDISRMRSRIVPTGSMKAVDRMEELSENYDRMKNRYDHHLSWLAEQAGAYRADIIELRKDK